MDRTHTRRTDENEIEPMVPDMSTAVRADGGDPAPRLEPRTRREPDRPPRTDYATPYTRDQEEVAPLVPDLR